VRRIDTWEEEKKRNEESRERERGSTKKKKKRRRKTKGRGEKIHSLGIKRSNEENALSRYTGL